MTRTDYGEFQVDALSPGFGGIVRNFQMSVVTEDSAKAIHDAWMDWKVLFFRDQDCSPAEHIAFARHFSDLEIHPFLPNDGNPEVVVFDSEKTKAYKANNWHTDVTFRECPPMGSILRGRIIPSVGGDTSFIDMERVYQDLDDETKQLIDGRTATHTIRKPFTKDMTAEEQAEQLELYPDQHHPMVRTHPVTGRKCLFVNKSFVEKIDDMEPEESDQLLSKLYDGYKTLEFHCRFVWEERSFAMWDNRCTQHYALFDYNERRRMERVTLTGSKPF